MEGPPPPTATATPDVAAQRIRSSDNNNHNHNTRPNTHTAPRNGVPPSQAPENPLHHRSSQASQPSLQVLPPESEVNSHHPNKAPLLLLPQLVKKGAVKKRIARSGDKPNPRPRKAPKVAPTVVATTKQQRAKQQPPGPHPRGRPADDEHASVVVVPRTSAFVERLGIVTTTESTLLRSLRTKIVRDLLQEGQRPLQPPIPTDPVEDLLRGLTERYLQWRSRAAVAFTARDLLPVRGDQGDNGTVETANTNPEAEPSYLQSFDSLAWDPAVRTWLDTVPWAESLTDRVWCNILKEEDSAREGGGPIQAVAGTPRPPVDLDALLRRWHSHWKPRFCEPDVGGDESNILGEGLTSQSLAFSGEDSFSSSCSRPPPLDGDTFDRYWAVIVIPRVRRRYHFGARASRTRLHDSKRCLQQQRLRRQQQQRATSHPSSVADNTPWIQNDDADDRWTTLLHHVCNDLRAWAQRGLLPGHSMRSLPVALVERETDWRNRLSYLQQDTFETLWDDAANRLRAEERDLILSLPEFALEDDEAKDSHSIIAVDAMATVTEWLQIAPLQRIAPGAAAFS